MATVGVSPQAYAEVRKRMLACQDAMRVLSIVLSTVEVFKIRPGLPLPELPPVTVIEEKPYYQRFKSKKRRRS